jgi:UDP-N-acetylmuramoyl-tripeptide--D-alanyl-D-alanine ligase
MRLNQEFIQKTIPGISFLYSTFPKNFLFSIDSRTIKEDEIFVALQGSQVDGHEFLKEALEKGASGLFIATEKKATLKNLDQSILKNKCVMVADDPYQSIIGLARAWRANFEYPVIGITGSVGKTSTKEILHTILDEYKMPHVRSQGNQNTLLGASLNILRMTSDHQVAIFEMGINKRGEMAQLADLVRPTTAVITAIGHCHMEGLGSIVDIAAEKRQIFKFFKEDSIGIINGDNPLLANVAYKHPVIKFGSKTTNQVQARKINIEGTITQFVLKLYGQKYNVTLKKNHSGVVFNTLAATAVAYLLNVPIKTILAAIEKPLTINGRFIEKPLKNGKGILIDDCYNANPESVKAALLAFEHISTKAQKIAVIGDMLELGVNSPFWHRQIGRFLRKAPSLRKVVLVGSLVQWTKKTIPVGVTVEHVPTWQEAKEYLQKELVNESAVLVKGSLGMKLKNLVNELT